MNGHVLTSNLMTFGDLIIGLAIGPILYVLERCTWQQAACVLLLLFRHFVIIPSSRNMCHASSSLFVICFFTSSCPDRTINFGLKKNSSALYRNIKKKKKKAITILTISYSKCFDLLLLLFCCVFSFSLPSPSLSLCLFSFSFLNFCQTQ